VGVISVDFDITDQPDILHSSGTEKK